MKTMKRQVVIIGAGPGGIFSAYELMEKKPELKVAVFEGGMNHNGFTVQSANDYFDYMLLFPE